MDLYYLLPAEWRAGGSYKLVWAREHGLFFLERLELLGRNEVFGTG